MEVHNDARSSPDSLDTPRPCYRQSLNCWHLSSERASLLAQFKFSALFYVLSISGPLHSHHFKFPDCHHQVS